MEIKQGVQNTAIIGAIVMGLVSTWFSTTERTGDDVIVLKPMVEQIDKRLAVVEDWQKVRPAQGELSADVRQTKDIEYLKAAASDMKANLERLENRIRDIELGGS